MPIKKTQATIIEVDNSHTNQYSGGSIIAPIFDIELEEKDGKIIVNMDSADADDIYKNKYAVIGVRKEEEHEEEEEPTYLVIYFALRYDAEDGEAIVYQALDTDDELFNLSQLNLIFMWDGDDAKVSLETHEFDFVSKKILDASEFVGGLPTLEELEDIIEKKYQIVEVINAQGISNQMYYLDTYNTYNSRVVATYSCKTSVDNDEIDVVGFVIEKDGDNDATLDVVMPDVPVVEGNATIPVGTIPATLSTLKVGHNYYNVGGGSAGLEMYVANITMAQDYTKFYFNATDLAYLKANIPFALKCVWDDGEGHIGSFVMTLAQTQGDQTGEMPRLYNTCYVESGAMVVATLKIDGGDTTTSGCAVEFGSITTTPIV